jgi:enterochelin esterase-like enzyme
VGGVALTGRVFLALVALLALASFAGAVAVMPRISGRRARSVVARSGVLILVNLMVLLTATVSLNDQFVFFADWTDLHGAMFGGQQVSTSAAGTTAARAANAPVPGSAATPTTPGLPGQTRVLPPLPAGAGVADRVLRYTVTGPRSGLRGVVLVTIPEGYTDPANAARTYPVLETFHGYPGDPSQWLDSMGLGTAIDAGVRAGKVGEMVTVSPALEFPGGVDTECVDGAGGAAQVETWLTVDIPNWVVNTFRVRTDRSAWATIGLSMGAWCAAMATMLHPQQYAAGIVMGGYFTPQFSANYRPFGPAGPQAHRYDLIALARQKPPSVALWVETSHSDHISYPSASKLLAAAHPPLSVQALVLNHAGHRLSLWQGELPQALSWLGKNLVGFHPAPGSS